MPANDQDLLRGAWQEIRSTCLNDLFFLAKYVLGYHDFVEEFHRPLCDVVSSVNHHIVTVSQMSGRKIKLAESFRPIALDSAVEHSRIAKYVSFDPLARERLFMAFRGSFKTTAISVAHTVQLMLIWPDIRILIASHKKEGGSQEILQAVKRHFVGNPVFRQLFPEYCPKPNGVGVIEWGTSERITLPNRSPSCTWPESTIEIAGLTTDVTGRHYDYIKNDDLVTRDSVTNETMIQKTREFKSLQKFLFNQPEWGVMDSIGTPYHFNDLYSTLRKGKGITKVIIPALDDRGEPVLPERFSKQGFETIKNDPTMGTYEFSCQYLMNPVPPEDQTFRPEWLERDGFFYDTPPDNLRVSVYVDPASRRRKTSDYTAILAIGVSETGTKYLLDIIRDKLGVEARTNLAMDICKKHQIHKLHYETIGFQDTDKYIIERKMREQDYFIEVIEMDGKKASKEDRIRGLQPLYQRGDIRWPRSYSYYSQYDKKKFEMTDILRDEMLMFPKCDHDDLLDCHSQMLQTDEFRPVPKTEPKPDDEFMRLRQITIDKKYPRKPLGRYNGTPKHSPIPFFRSWR